MRHGLGIDLGTSSLKALLLDEEGRLVATASRSYPIAVPQPGWAEQDPEHWWNACGQTIGEILTRTGISDDQVEAVAVTGQMHGTVLLDEAGSPLRPAIIWPDQRAASEAREAEAALAARDLLARLGGGVTAGFMLASLLWGRAHEPELWRRVRTALLPKDYLRYRLTGVLAGEPSDACGIPACDLHTWEWSKDALASLDLQADLLPPLYPSEALGGGITAGAARDCGLRPGTPVLLGGSDQATAAIGAGLLHPGTLLISISTGGQLVTPLAAPLPAPAHGARTLAHALPRRPGRSGAGYLALSATLGAGLSLRWLREEVFGDRAEGADARLIALAAQAPPGAGGLLFLPYLTGERAPILDPAASGALVGLRLDHGRAHLARAALEGVAYSLLQALEPLQAAGVRARRVVLAGGLAQAPLMRGIMAAVLGQAVIPLETAEQSALGAALLAAVHAGFFPSLEEGCAVAVRYGEPVEPEPEAMAQYAALYSRYRELYPALREEMHALVDED
ncbi:MAG TPA: xylulokinase [Chloroflexota bacterium]|nr:xylulokinase [Chloroflexota bacterium]